MSGSICNRFVHQELNLFNDLRVYENIFFNKELVTRTGRLRKSEMIQKCQELFTRLGVEIPTDALVENLSASEKQTLEIAKAICFDAKLLILDEPTTALSNEEIDHLIAIVLQTCGPPTEELLRAEEKEQVICWLQKTDTRLIRKMRRRRPLGLLRTRGFRNRRLSRGKHPAWLPAIE